AAL
ncbi:hypothetical protein D020_2098B, partial [Vibrio parahaemolyticus SBR10290]